MNLRKQAAGRLIPNGHISSAETALAMARRLLEDRRSFLL